MKPEEIKLALQNIKPDDNTKEEILENIIKGKKKKKRSYRRWFSRMTVAAAASIVLIVVTTIGINGATKGAVVKAVCQMFGLSGQTKETKEVINQTTRDITRNMVFAPEILYLDDKMLIFAGDRGIMVYDRIEKEISHSIDFQKTDCLFWDTTTGETHTHAFYDDGMLWVFNEKDGNKTGKFYSYLLDDNSSAKEYNDTSLWKEIYHKWKKIDRNYKDTFTEFINDKKGFEEEDGEIMYSERCWCWDSKKQGNCMSFITVPSDEKGSPTEKRFVLNTYNIEKEQMLSEDLVLPSDKKNSMALPEFEYTGDDPIIAAIVDSKVINSEAYWKSDSAVWIPGYLIYDKIEKDGSLYVFGRFWGFSYYLNGNTLMCESGGEQAARVELKKQSDGNYQIVDVKKAGDGAEYQEGIKRFCKGFRGVYEKFFEDINNHDKRREECRKEFVKMYEEQNQLGIEYYKDYGWEPVSIKK
ncbi:MAG: hypothetical protein E7277_04920 [Lachnospiraceae bacterium]|nr:hypothetical protein [Lachnospiraceae bacterium]